MKGVKDRRSKERAQIYEEIAQPRSHLLKERLIRPNTGPKVDRTTTLINHSLGK
jgi:hypothetical protein